MLITKKGFKSVHCQSFWLPPPPTHLIKTKTTSKQTNNNNNNKLEEEYVVPEWCGTKSGQKHRQPCLALPCPALARHFPHLSHTEQVRDQLKRRLQQRQHPPRTVQDLYQGVFQEWQNVPQESVGRFMRSVRHRCQIKPRSTRVVRSTELGQFQNHAVLAEVAEATIRDSEMTFDLFQYLNN